MVTMNGFGMEWLSNSHGTKRRVQKSTIPWLFHYLKRNGHRAVANNNWTVQSSMTAESICFWPFHNRLMTVREPFLWAERSLIERSGWYKEQNGLELKQTGRYNEQKRFGLIKKPVHSYPRASLVSVHKKMMSEFFISLIGRILHFC